MEDSPAVVPTPEVEAAVEVEDNQPQKSPDVSLYYGLFRPYNFCRAFYYDVLLMDVNEWLNYECSAVIL